MAMATQGELAWRDVFPYVRPDDVAGFIAAQIAGALTATLTIRWLAGDRSGLSE